MNTDDGETGLAPAVESILAAARERTATGRVHADARPLAAALSRAAANGRVPVIGEVKPTSPTTDGQRTDDPTDLAHALVDGGVAALSVLTEPAHFGGSTEALARIRRAVDVPVLRKDFLLYEAQLDAVAADAVLLIARFLGPSGPVEDADTLDRLVRAARDRGMEPLVEVHDRTELERAIAAGATTIGVNNRDLARLEVDLGTFERVAPMVPDSVTLIAESGITTPADAARMRAAGADGLLIGSALMAGDVRANARRLTTAASAGTDTRTHPEAEPES